MKEAKWIIGGLVRDEKRKRYGYMVKCFSCGKERFLRSWIVENKKPVVCLSCACALRSRGNTNRSTHRASKTTEYNTWSSMKARCYNIKAPAYKHYGARGIKISSCWLGPNGFETFLKDMGPKPSKKHSIDRIDNNRGYSKENCRWATALLQCNNTRKNRKWYFGGEELTTAQLARKLNINVGTLNTWISRAEKERVSNNILTN